MSCAIACASRAGDALSLRRLCLTGFAPQELGRMAKIVISYRRSDSDAIAGRIRDRLASHFGEDSLFMDIDNIPFGTDFRQHIKSALLSSDVVIVVVGPKW